MKNFLSTVKPLVYLISDGTFTAENFAEKKEKLLRLVKTAVEAEIALIQIREKQISARLVFALSSEIVKSARNSHTKILINDRADIALAANADGVHLTAESISVAVIKTFCPENFIVGVSAHTLREVARAERQGANFAAFSPIFQTPDKGESQGIERLKKACEQVKHFPVIALGGIDEKNFADVLQAGASGFAAIRFLSDENNLRKLGEGFYNDSKP